MSAACLPEPNCTFPTGSCIAEELCPLNDVGAFFIGLPVEAT